MSMGFKKEYLVVQYLFPASAMMRLTKNNEQKNIDGLQLGLLDIANKNYSIFIIF